jgi:hypothetical protein
VRARRTLLAAGITLVGATASTRDARAVDLPRLGDAPVKLDVTETAIVAQRFNARDGEIANDQGYFAFLNRLNLVLGWKKLTLGARLDSSLYAFRPEDRAFPSAQEQRNAQVDGATRYRDAIYPAKVFVTYKSEGVELTVGDAYAQLGRGLVLSVRKVDELGIDTTILGAKLIATKDIFGLTLLGGIANPARVDEPTGRALFLAHALPGDRLGAQPVFGSDRVFGASLTAGRGLPVVASTNAVVLSRCAPYRYNADGTINDGAFDAPLGTCEPASRETFLASLPSVTPILKSRETINASQTVEIPNLWGHGNLYLEGAVQKRDAESPTDPSTEGNALYGAFVTSGGPVTNTVEFKSYRNFYPLTGSVNISRASAFANIAYSAPPTAEPVITDTMFGAFNVCVTGGRDRLDYRLTDTLLVYGTFGYFRSQSEQPGGQCDHLGRSTSTTPDESTNLVTDLSAGAEWRFDDDRSIAFFNVTGRNDVKGSGDAYYREIAGQYSVTKYIAGPYAIELAGRHRYRIQDHENIRGDSFAGEPWWQGEHQTALKVAPKWILSQGVEYTSYVGQPSTYLNGGVLYRFSSQSNIRLYAGQNRGGLRCVSGICRVFPAFSGARAELTLRF